MFFKDQFHATHHAKSKSWTLHPSEIYPRKKKKNPTTSDILVEKTPKDAFEHQPLWSFHTLYLLEPIRGSLFPRHDALSFLGMMPQPLFSQESLVKEKLSFSLLPFTTGEHTLDQFKIWNLYSSPLKEAQHKGSPLCNPWVLLKKPTRYCSTTLKNGLLTSGCTRSSKHTISIQICILSTNWSRIPRTRDHRPSQYLMCLPKLDHSFVNTTHQANGCDILDAHWP